MYVYVVKNYHGRVMTATISRTKAMVKAVECEGVPPRSPEGEEMVRNMVSKFSDAIKADPTYGNVQVQWYEIEYFRQ